MAGGLAGWIVRFRRISCRLEMVGVYLYVKVMWAGGCQRAPDSISASAKLAQNSDCIFTFLAEISCV